MTCLTFCVLLFAYYKNIIVTVAKCTINWCLLMERLLVTVIQPLIIFCILLDRWRMFTNAFTYPAVFFSFVKADSLCELYKLFERFIHWLIIPSFTWPMDWSIFVSDQHFPMYILVCAAHEPVPVVVTEAIDCPVISVGCGFSQLLWLALCLMSGSVASLGTRLTSEEVHAKTQSLSVQTWTNWASERRSQTTFGTWKQAAEKCHA